MLIDLILDRKDGQAYNSRAFYNACMGYAQTFPCCLPVVRALDGGTEQDVISELCNYIQEQGIPPYITMLGEAFHLYVKCTDAAQSFIQNIR